MLQTLALPEADNATDHLNLVKFRAKGNPYKQRTQVCRTPVPIMVFSVTIARNSAQMISRVYFSVGVRGQTTCVGCLTGCLLVADITVTFCAVEVHI